MLHLSPYSGSPSPTHSVALRNAASAWHDEVIIFLDLLLFIVIDIIAILVWAAVWNCGQFGFDFIKFLFWSIIWQYGSKYWEWIYFSHVSYIYEFRNLILSCFWIIGLLGFWFWSDWNLIVSSFMLFVMVSFVLFVIEI